MPDTFTKNYKLKLETRYSPEFDVKLVYKDTYQNINKFQTEDGFLLKSNLNRISDGFKLTQNLAQYHHIKDDFIIDQKEQINKNSLYKELNINPQFLLDPILFLKRYNTIIHPSLNNLPYKDYSYMEAKILTDKVILSINPDYENIEEYLYKVYLVDFYIFLYEKISDYFNIKKEDLLNLEPGFYNIDIKNNNKVFNILKNDKGLLLTDSSFLEIYSLYNVSFNNWSTQFYTVTPKSNIQITLNNTDYNQLNNISEFKQNIKYIVFKLIENNNRKYYSPLFLVSPDAEILPEQYKKLLNSHPEYLKSYAFISESTDLTIRYAKNNSIVEDTINIKNLKFDKLYNSLKESNLDNINITLI